MKTTVQIRKRGVVVIPEAVRIAMRIGEGDIIEIDIINVCSNQDIKVT